ncbi:MAG TPA: hypothetical protein VFQ85_16725 [Mycobacteriales bacterium]|jgi:hypothetical protein|nr:hypothetical protein [Mycobacteriales bacterium]
MALKRCALAVSVLFEIDVEPADHGLLVSGVPEVHVSWRECRRALAGADPEGDEGRRRLARWLLRRRWLADHTYDDLAERARPVGLPVDHVLHPGLDWVRTRVMGDALDLGLGFVGIQPGQPDRVTLMPQEALEAAGLADVAGAWWLRASNYLERMGAMAAERFFRGSAADVLRPMGDCDVVTLLGSWTFRGALAGGDAGGMRPVVVPMRSRGWADVSRIDPAFGPAAATATDAVDRGFARPLLVTADEVSMVRAGGDVALAISDPAPAESWLQPLLYR